MGFGLKGGLSPERNGLGKEVVEISITTGPVDGTNQGHGFDGRLSPERVGKDSEEALRIRAAPFGGEKPDGLEVVDI